jgi:DNA-binding transcriptional MocR family regulator
MKRYHALAAEIARSIESGLLKPGDRLPSVRQASASHGVSPATVFAAYYLLESRALVQARARSGYYVSATPARLPPEPETPSRPDGESRPVAISELVFQILESVTSREVVPLGSAFPSPLLFPLRKLGKAMCASVEQMDPWATVDDLTPGSLALRRQIALRYLLDGVRVEVEHIVISNGAMEALNLCLSALCQPGDAIIVESPCFYGCLQTIEQHGLRAVEVATDPRDGIDLAALELAIDRHQPSACWLMSNFQNPLGGSMGGEKKAALVELLRRRRLPMIEDDVYGELYFGARPPLAKSFDREGWVLHCSSFSKTLAPGYRIGWVAPGRFAQALARQKLMASLATCLPAQLALARFLEKGGYDRHLRALRKTLAENRDQYLEAISRHFPPGTRVSRPAGGYFLWLELPAGRDALAIQRQAMAAGISVAPGPMFSASHAFGDCLRLNFGHPFDARVDAALRLIGRAAE